MMKTENLNPAYPQHSLLKSIVLHVLPGLLTTLGFIAFKPLLDSSNYPPLLAFLLAVMLIDLPVMWVIMWYEGRKANGRFNLDQIVLYREKVTWKSFTMIFIGAFVLAYGLIMLAIPITDWLSVHVFSELPAWLFLDEQSQYYAFPRNVLVAVFTFQLVLTGVTLPWTEELYFRGYLLPRIERYGKWSPLFGGLLFGLYHVWQPFGIVSVFLLGILLGYLVWWQRDIRLSIGLHVTANMLARLASLLVILVM
jgi:membrane protease YdiL (CAAX protease family)